jgi:hypothetical protein
VSVDVAAFGAATVDPASSSCGHAVCPLAHVKTPRSTTAPRKNRSGTVRVVRNNASEPRLPHERDESVSDNSQTRGVTQARIGRKAFDDIRAGRVDTDRGPVLEEVARTLKPLPDAAPPSKRGRRAR